MARNILRLPEWWPRNGSLVKACRLVGQELPKDDSKKLGIVISTLPPLTGHEYLVKQILVGWTCPIKGWHVTIEPDHRITKVDDE